MSSADDLPPAFFRWPLTRLTFAAVALIGAFGLIVGSERISAFLRRDSGDSMARIAAILPWLFSTLLLAGVVGFAVAWWKRNAAKQFWFRLATEPSKRPETDPTRRSLLRWLATVGIVVVAFDGLSLKYGYFETDDFDLLRIERERGPLGSAMTTHNDHTIPLLRLEFSAMRTLFGVNPLAWNFVNLSTFAILLWSGCLLLRELRLSKFSIGIYLLGCVIWTPWGKFTSGEYILEKYTQITICSLICAWATLRHLRTERRGYAAVIVGTAVFAILLNLSGLWVPCVWGAVTVCGLVEAKTGKTQTEFFQELRVRFLKQGVPLAVGVIASVLVHIMLYRLPGNQEFLSISEAAHTPLSLLSQLFQFAGSLLLEVVLPVPHLLVNFGLLGVGLTLAWIIFGLFLAVTGRSAPGDLRPVLFGGTLAVLGDMMMVSLGRPHHGWGFFVAPKYLGPAWVWLWIVIAIGWQSLVDRMSLPARAFAIKVTFFAMIASVVSNSTASVLGALGVPFFDNTRGAFYAEHRRERAALQEIRDELFAPLERKKTVLVIPDVPSDVLAERYPSLRFPWGEARPLSNFVDVLANDPHRVRFVATDSEQLRQVSPAFWELVDSSEAVSRLYEGVVEVPTSELPPAD